MATVNLAELIERLDGDQLDRVAALVAAKSVTEQGVPAPDIKRTEFPHELTGLARFILHGTDIFNDEEDEN